MTTISLKVPENQIKALKDIIEKSGLTVEFQEENIKKNWIQFASEEALAEDWNSEEDERYEKYFEE